MQIFLSTIFLKFVITDCKTTNYQLQNQPGYYRTYKCASSASCLKTLPTCTINIHRTWGIKEAHSQNERKRKGQRNNQIPSPQTTMSYYMTSPNYKKKLHSESLIFYELQYIHVGICFGIRSFLDTKQRRLICDSILPGGTIP